MTTVRQLLDQKGGNIWSIHPDATVFDAIVKMAEKDIGSLVVMEGDEFVGIITERHYARNVVLKGKTSPATPVRDIMERHVVIALPEQSVDQCMALMSEKHVRAICRCLREKSQLALFQSAILSKAQSVIRSS
jgi:predicted transcriptional regulator